MTQFFSRRNFRWSRETKTPGRNRTARRRKNIKNTDTERSRLWMMAEIMIITKPVRVRESRERTPKLAAENTTLEVSSRVLT